MKQHSDGWVEKHLCIFRRKCTGVQNKLVISQLLEELKTQDIAVPLPNCAPKGAVFCTALAKN
jgi:hypothetical protein